MLEELIKGLNLFLMENEKYLIICYIFLTFHKTKNTNIVKNVINEKDGRNLYQKKKRKKKFTKTM